MTPPIRTITIGVAEPHPIPADALASAVVAAQRARAAFVGEGYVVQSIRIATRPMLDDLADWLPTALVEYAVALESRLTEGDPELIASIGPAAAHRPAFDVNRIELLGEVLVRTRSLFGTVQLATAGDGLRYEAAVLAARVALRLANETDEGFGAFRFAAIACVEPGSPFFPAGYHDGPASLSIGWQGASVVAAVAGEGPPESITARVRDAVIGAGTPIVALGQRMAAELGLRFGGLDPSPAPYGDDSIGAAIEACGYGRIGSPGTLTVVGALTAALKDTGLPTCGYAGLMLPVMEDPVLAQRWSDRDLGIHQVLAYSAICGTGLDAIPLAGDVSEDEMAAIYLDMATLALRLGKPLSARLLPVPGKKKGEVTSFTSPHLVNTRI